MKINIQKSKEFKHKILKKLHCLHQKFMCCPTLTLTFIHLSGTNTVQNRKLNEYNMDLLGSMELWMQKFPSNSRCTSTDASFIININTQMWVLRTMLQIHLTAAATMDWLTPNFYKRFIQITLCCFSFV